MIVFLQFSSLSLKNIEKVELSRVFVFEFVDVAWTAAIENSTILLELNNSWDYVLISGYRVIKILQIDFVIPLIPNETINLDVSRRGDY